MTSPYPIFTYWEGDRSALEPFRVDWTAAGHDVHVFALEDVWPILAMDLNPDRLALFGRIRIAACRSDLARLLLLRKNGGLYIDAHTGSGNQAKLARLFAHLAAKELVVFDQAGEGRAPDDIYLLNGAMLARRNSALLSQIINACFANLERHWVRERQSTEHVTYNVFALTGGWTMRHILFDVDKKPFRLKMGLSDRVHLEVLHPSKGAPAFVWYQHYQYRKAGQHWSERQKLERLFDPG